jgi:HD-GYP domain-containing protein (c-di-GMP phosphodiesterase class II)
MLSASATPARKAIFTTMLRVPIGQAEPGMRLAMRVLHPQRGNLLLNEGLPLDALLIRRLAELEVTEIWIEYPGAEQIRQYISPTLLVQQSQLVTTIAEMIDRVQRESYADLDFERYRKTIQGMIEALVSEPLSAAYIMELGGAAGSDLRHASEVCLLSVLLGLKLQGYLIEQRKRLLPRDARDVVSLGMGAMLHDIGKALLDPDVRDRYERERDQTDPHYREHVTLGHRMLSGAIASSAVGVVLHHHQHFDGSGFPASPGIDGALRGLAGEDIHVFARIACVANHFDRLRRPPSGQVQPRVRVLHAMLGTNLAARFDPVILAMLPAVVPAYPPGSIVRLSNDARAVVVHWHTEAPCQPTVQTLEDPTLPSHELTLAQIANNMPCGRTIDLRQEPELRVIEHDGQNVSADNFRLIQPPGSPQKNAA